MKHNATDGARRASSLQTIFASALACWSLDLPRPEHVGFGRRVASIADVTRDGLSDVITVVGTRFPQARETVWVLSGHKLELISKIPLPAETQLFTETLVLAGPKAEQLLLVPSLRPDNQGAELLRYRLSDGHRLESIAIDSKHRVMELVAFTDTAASDRVDRHVLYYAGRSLADLKEWSSTWLWRVDLDDKSSQRIPRPHLANRHEPLPDTVIAGSWCWSLRPPGHRGVEPILAFHSGGGIAVFFDGVANPPAVFGPPPGSPPGFGGSVSCCADEDGDNRPEILVSAVGGGDSNAKGTVYWFSSKSNQPYREIDEALRLGGVGCRLLRVGDHDADGTEDFLVSQVTSIAGCAVDLVSGKTGGKLRRIAVDDDLPNIGHSTDSDPYQRAASARFVVDRYSIFTASHPRGGLTLTDGMQVHGELRLEDLARN